VSPRPNKFSHPAAKPINLAFGWVAYNVGNTLRSEMDVLGAALVPGDWRYRACRIERARPSQAHGRSKAEPPIKQDGTPAHPFADASQCPSSTDLIIWPRDRATPSVPPGISVCFVGSQSFNDNGPAVQVRQR
jgi:hypothetical protein